MIRVRWSRKSGFMQITVEGHEPNGEPGSAIVCSAVSAIVQTTVAGLMSVATSYPGKVEVVEDEIALPRCTQCQHPVQVHDQKRGCAWCVCGQRHP